MTEAVPAIAALRNSYESLRALVEPLDAGQLRAQSYDTEWSIAQVLSHIGSQSEIFGLFLDAGLSGQDAPGMEVFRAIWDEWNARSPEAQAADAVAADKIVTERFESLDAGQRERLRLKMFGRDLDTSGLAMMRLGEHAVHTWDVAVALDPAATVAPDAVGLLVDTLPDLTARAGKPDGKQRRIRISTTDPERHFSFGTSETVTLTPAEAGDDGPQLRLPAEALVRLVYGRLDPAHTPPTETGEVDLDELRRVFPGF